jgi:DNA polymerase
MSPCHAGSTPANPTALARQHALTGMLLGVDFLPKRGRGSFSVPEGAARGVEPLEKDPRPLSKQAALDDLRRRHDAECPHCTSVTGHRQTVFGEGHPDADLLFVGEAPGEEEDRTGRPFVGRAGQKLDEIIAAMGLRREDVYIANILKSRPPNNRTPLQPEVDACSPYLVEQIRIIEPRVIVCLGGPSTKFMLQTNVGITRLRGQWASYEDVVAGLSIPIMPTFHPAYLLRNYTEDTRRKVWSDMQAVLERLGTSAG